MLGVTELPEFLRLAHRRTVSAWQQRDVLPPADYPSVNGSKAWRRLTIIRWAATTGRIPPWLNAEAEANGFLINGHRRPRIERAASV